MLRLTALMLLASALGGCQQPTIGAQTSAPGGDPEHGRAVIAKVGCGACHVVPGVAGAHGLVGPPLEAFSERTVIAGFFPNTPPNLIQFIKAPQEVLPGNAMPNMEIDDHDARDVAAYLYTLR